MDSENDLYFHFFDGIHGDLFVGRFTVELWVQHQLVFRWFLRALACVATNLAAILNRLIVDSFQVKKQQEDIDNWHPCLLYIPFLLSSISPSFQLEVKKRLLSIPFLLSFTDINHFKLSGKETTGRHWHPCLFSNLSYFLFLTSITPSVQVKKRQEDFDILVYPAANYQRPKSDRKHVNITKVVLG